MERLILIDEKNLNKRSRWLKVSQKLNYIKSHYIEIKRSRINLLKEFAETFNNEKLEKIEENSEDSLPKPISKEEFFVTDKKSDLIEGLKLRSQNRAKEFEDSSSERMKDIKSKLDEIRNKFTSMPVLDDDRKEKIKQKINNAIKAEEKSRKAEEIIKKIQDREEGRGPQRVRNTLEDDKYSVTISDTNTNTDKHIAVDSNQNNSLLTESVFNKSHISHFSQASQVSQVSYKNSLLTDQSDISYVKKHEDYNQLK
jgi:hypothetical protein